MTRDDPKPSRKKLLPLRKDTLRNLARAELQHVAGASIDPDRTMGHGNTGGRIPDASEGDPQP
jgi:hypothetical protein